MARSAKPTRRQVAAVREVVSWYIKTHFRRPGDAGTLDDFCDAQKVGHFAVNREAVGAGESRALFRLLVTVAMFQRRQDVQIQRILQGISRRDAFELTDSRRLLRLADSAGCAQLSGSAQLHGSCDLAKTPNTRTGTCGVNPSNPCYLKRHTVLLKRYGHFGKVPTSIALVMREAKVARFGDLHARVLRTVDDPAERARALEVALSQAWRINQKLSAMFLSAVTNPDLSPGATPWREGVDWTYFVVIDSNVDLLLAAIGYRGAKTYEARRCFIQRLAAEIELDRLDPRLTRFNPRVVQQAMYLFMSKANRRVATGDCMHGGPAACGRCPQALTRICPVHR